MAATAWISSTITASTPASIDRRLRGEDQVERLGGRDQDVGRIAHHRGALALGRVAGADRDARRRRRCRCRAGACAGCARCHRRVPSAARRRATRVPRPVRRRPCEACLGLERTPFPRRPCRARDRSSAHRNAASVLPEPVGADSSTFSPRAIAGHACAWAGVGVGEGRLEPVADAGVNLERGSLLGGRRHPALRLAGAGGTRPRPADRSSQAPRHQWPRRPRRPGIVGGTPRSLLEHRRRGKDDAQALGRVTHVLVRRPSRDSHMFAI